MKVLLWAPLGAGEHYWGPGTSAYRLYGSCPSKAVTIDLAHGFALQEDPQGVFRNSYFIADLSNGGLWATLRFLLKSWFFVQKYYHEYDVVHCLGAFEISFRPALWFSKKGVKAFCKITDEKGGIVGNSFISRFLGIAQMRKRQLNHISGYIAISTEIVEILKAAGVEEAKIHKIPNGVNVNHFKPVVDANAKRALRLKYGIEENDFIILFVGGISSRKRPFELVEVFKRMIDDHHFENFNLVLLGPDRSGQEDLLSKIYEYVETNKLNRFISHFDHSSSPVDFYQLSDVFVLPSRSEGMSNAVLESLSCGIPCIVTPVSGMRDMVLENNNGFIEQLDNFPDRIMYYFKNKKALNEHSLFARNYIVDNFSSVQVLEAHFRVFKS